MDPETQFLWSKQQTGNEWELFKENVRPLKRGRNVRLLNDGLKSHTDYQLKKALIEHRRRMIEAIDEYKGDDPLQPWLECIKWIQEAFPQGGDYSGLVMIYEQCVRAFWDSDRYKDDIRYLKVWLDYADNCADAEVIYSFLDANKIGLTQSIYYIAYALHMESKNKLRNANDMFNLGIARNAQPTEKMETAFKKFLARSMRRTRTADEDSTENRLPVRSFGTVLAKGRQGIEGSDSARKRMKTDRAHGALIPIYEDKNASITSSHQPDLLKAEMKPWCNLGARAERNKENNAIPTKWTSMKIPQRPGSRLGGTTGSACIEVFVDEECAEVEKVVGKGKSSSLQLRREDGQDLKKETELLRENPLRNFPAVSLPR